MSLSIALQLGLAGLVMFFLGLVFGVMLYYAYLKDKERIAYRKKMESTLEQVLEYLRKEKKE